MAQVRVDNLQTLTQVSSVLGRVTENTKELSLVSQVKYGTLIVIAHNANGNYLRQQ